MLVQIEAAPMMSNNVPWLSLGWLRATANTLMEERIGCCHLSPPAEEEEGGMKGKHDLAPVIFPKVAHHHHNQSKRAWDALGGAVWGVGDAERLIIPELL